MRSNKEFWRKHWVEALVMLPSYLFLAILIAKLNLLLWIAVIFVSQYILRVTYNNIVVERKFLKNRMTRAQSSVMFFFSQLLVLCAGVVLVSVNPWA